MVHSNAVQNNNFRGTRTRTCTYMHVAMGVPRNVTKASYMYIIKRSCWASQTILVAMAYQSTIDADNMPVGTIDNPIPVGSPYGNDMSSRSHQGRPNTRDYLLGLIGGYKDKEEGYAGFVVDDSYDKTIVLLGKTGVGKSTIARHIFKDEAEKFPNAGSVGSTTRKARLYDSIHSLSLGRSDVDNRTKVRVVIMDTNSLHGRKYDLNQLRKPLYKISTVFFVLKYGRVTEEDCEPFEEIIQKLPANVFGVCHLVVTGCEGQDEAARMKIADLYRSDPMTHNLCQSVTQIHFVGFPDLNGLLPVMRELYTEGIQKDELAIQEIAKTSVQFVDLPIHKERSWCSIS